MSKKQILEAKKMYSPAFEKDACGMGFVTQIDGVASHGLVDQALTVLERMNHRGGTGAEPDTGDGAGILMALPDTFFQKKANQQHHSLPEKGNYAVGMFFLPYEPSRKKRMIKELKTEIKMQGYRVLWIRDVPFAAEHCGPSAQKKMPSFVQFFIEKPVDVDRGRMFENVLFYLRRHIEKTFSPKELTVVSLSSQTVIYKGMLHAYQVRLFFPDLQDKTMETAIALVHSRFSTNTFPSWDRAQPFRFLAHNGEINTLRGTENWMRSHHVEIYNEDNSDSAKLENCMEYLYLHGRDIPQALMMMIPEAWSKEAKLPDEVASFYEYTANFMTPWDGPAALCFTDGIQVGATLDRNGLRPSRYSLTKENLLVVASEAGVIDLSPSSIIEKGVLGPGNMILVDTSKGTFLRNDEIKHYYASQHPYRNWLNQGQLTLDKLKEQNSVTPLSSTELRKTWKLYGYTDEVIRTLILPMAEKGEEPVISMGYDSPLAVLSNQPQTLFTYFKQQFAQVTNPPIDAIRERLVIGTEMFLGRDGDLKKDFAGNCHKLKIETPVLSTNDFEKICALKSGEQQTKTLSILYPYDLNDSERLQHALERLFKDAEHEIDQGASILILSDRHSTKDNLSIPILLAVSGLHHYLITKGKRSMVSLVADSAEVCEVHHFALLLGYGVSAIYPYGVYETLKDYHLETKQENYRKAAEKGIVKVMSRMGISTIAGYHSAQLFEAVGLSEEVVQNYFTGTSSRIGGLTLAQIEKEYLKHHDFAYGKQQKDALPSGGSYQYKTDGEHHLYNPNTIYNFQKAVRSGDYQLYKQYVAQMNREADEQPTTLRSLWDLKSKQPAIALSEVEPAKEIVKRFKVGAMSFGSLSQEAHECLAEAMNSIGAKSNCGEGGENRLRFRSQKDGRNLNSKIKQVASARFGVNTEYLMSAEEIQIKMAQGAKPGEGGQLPGNKVFPWVASIRGATPGVRLISPPPHHDIYSIEDLAQLIYDLKMVNPYAKISVKLAASTGVGTIATGVVKAGADKVVICGYDGGTGASPKNSVRDAGLPWEMGLAEAHQTLSINNLRQRMTLETDGKLMTGRDIAVAALLGAEEYSFASLALVSIGCVMMRVCSLNTCPVGIATQNPELRKFFAGKPEHVVNTMFFLAEDLREIMAELGYRTIDEMIGHTESLCPKFIAKGKAKSLDFSRILGTTLGIERKVENPFIKQKQWEELDAFAEQAIQSSDSLCIEQRISNVERSVGARMGGWIAERFGNDQISSGKICYHYQGVAGQSFGAFITQGMELKLTGEANDYVGKGLSGGRLIVVPPEDAAYETESAPIVGNVVCFGASAGEGYFNGRAGERFCVRNSGARVVVEGIGDHGCEYMTGGVAVILGTTGRNFAAGMSGGVAYIYDPDQKFDEKCNKEMVDIFPINTQGDDSILKEMLENHVHFTDSKVAKQILANWEKEQEHFLKVYPTEYRQMLEVTETLSEKGFEGEELLEAAFNQVMNPPKETPNSPTKKIKVKECE